LNRFDPANRALSHWDLDSEPACIAAALDGTMLIAMRDGLWRFDTAAGQRTRLAEPPYDPKTERFNDGKCDPLGRFWVGTIYEPRDRPAAALYCWGHGKLERKASDITSSNGLAWSPDARTMYWADTAAHTVYAIDLDGVDCEMSPRRVFMQFPPKRPGQNLIDYGGRPDGAAMDVEGGYWIAMFEGQRLLRLSPEGRVLREVVLPVRCPTMPCFGGADLRTLYVTTSREKRPAAELIEQPLAGCVLSLRVDVPGLPAHMAA